MKKRIVLASVIALSMMILAGCGKTDNAQTQETDSTPSVIYNPVDYVTLGDYSNIEIAVATPVVTNEQIDAEIAQFQKDNTTYEDITDRTAMTGDQTNIGFVGTIDGVAFDGGTSGDTGYDLVLGSGSMVPGFEEGIIGMAIGEEKNIDVTFPMDYSADLAGKEVQFAITLNSLKKPVVPALTDEFIVSINPSCANLAELRSYYSTQLMTKAESDYDLSTKNAAFTKVYEAATFKDELPDGLLDTYVAEEMKTNQGYADSLGIDLAALITNYYGMTEDDFNKLVNERALAYARQEILIRAIAQIENMTATDEEMQAFAEKNYSTYGFTSADDLLAQIPAVKVAMLIESDKVIALIMDHTVITEP